jgi:integrase
MSEQALIPTTGQLSLEVYIAAWVQAKEGLSGSQRTRNAYAATLADFRAMLQQGGLDLDSPAPLVALAAQGWAALARNTRGKPVSNATYNLRLAIVSSFYRYLRRATHGAWTSNPIDGVERRKVQEYASARPLSPTAARKALARLDLDDLKGARDAALFWIAFTTGRRASELGGLCWGDVEREGNQVRLTFRRVKGGREARDLLRPKAAQMLLAWLARYYGDLDQLAPEAPLWVPLAHNATRPALSYAHIRRATIKALGTGKVHATRHTFAREMEKAGAPVSTIAARLAQKGIGAVSRYLQALSSDENPYGDTLEDVFAGEE